MHTWLFIAYQHGPDVSCGAVIAFTRPSQIASRPLLHRLILMKSPALDINKAQRGDILCTVPTETEQEVGMLGKFTTRNVS